MHSPACRFSRHLVAPLVLGTLLTVLVGARGAERKRLTLDEVFGAKAVDLRGKAPFGLRWVTDTEYVWPRRLEQDGKPVGTEWLRVEAETGRATPLFDSGKMAQVLQTVPGVSTEEALRLSRQPTYRFEPQYRGVLLDLGGSLYYYQFASHDLTRLTYAPGECQDATFSPDGRRIAFVRGHNLYSVDLRGVEEQALTVDGSEEVRNGQLDWVYSEEIYGRGNLQAYWWSPDSSRIAFLRLDDTAVPTFSVPDHLQYPYSAESVRYPRAGDPNPTARLGVVPAAGGAVTWVETDRYTPGNFLIVQVGWTPDSRGVVYQVQNREQTWLDLNVADPRRGARTLTRERTPAWVDTRDNPLWLKDGTFLWQSDRSGHRHLYHFAADGSLRGAVTHGDWDLMTLLQLDEADGWVYFTGTERSPTSTDLYRCRLDGGELRRLSEQPGTHLPILSPRAARWLDFWSSIRTPPQVALYRSDGSLLRALYTEPLPAQTAYQLSYPELVRVKTHDGFALEGMLFKPPDFDPARRYPVLQLTYAGPQLPLVRDSWFQTGNAFRQYLLQQGIILWICDNRSASGKGAGVTWPIYHRLGESELSDIEDGIAWLKQQPFVDGDRIGIQGASYGGYMTCYALTHSKSFRMGIAEASVTDWRDYDSVYTERYLGLPQDHPEAYEKASPRFAAKDLHGDLLLIHGTADDNVHLQSTLQFAYELQKAGKPFQMMLYPASRHGVTDPQLVRHREVMILDYLKEHLCR